MKPKYSKLCPKTSQETSSCVCPEHHAEGTSDPEPGDMGGNDIKDPAMFLPDRVQVRGHEILSERAESSRFTRRANQLVSNIALILMFFGGCMILVSCAELLGSETLGCEGEDDPHTGACGRMSAASAATRPPPAQPMSCMDKCTFTLVESIPQNLTYGPKEYVHMSTYAGLKTLLASAKKSVRIASFYWTLRGVDLPFHDSSAEEGEDIFNSLMQMSKEGKVSLQIAQNAVNNDTDLIAKQGGAEVRTLNFTHLIGNGVLHTKFWLVDDQHFYIGSANLDWRSLTQVKELGIVVQNCSCLANDLAKVFQVYWYLGKPGANIPPSWPPQFSTAINASAPAIVAFNGTQAPVYMSSSPPPFCPKGRTGDIEAIVQVIKEAKEFVDIAVMDYSPTSLYIYPNVYWPVIDDALRHAAFDRRVRVRLLASRWKHTHKAMYAFLCSLRMMGYVHYPRVSMEVKLFEVPIYTKNQSEIPYSRVNHNKYMVTDQHAYIGTSNWSEDYFTNTAGVGFVVRQPHGSMNTTRGNLRQQLYDVFNRDWFSNFSSDLQCSFNFSTKPTHHSHFNLS